MATKRELEMRALLEEHASTGMTLSAFARSKGVRTESLYRWRSRLRGKDKPSRCDFVELGVSDASAVSSDRLEIRIMDGEVQISAPADFDDDRLLRMLFVLRQC